MGDMENFFDSLESLQEERPLYDEEALSLSEFPIYGKFLELDNCSNVQPKEDFSEQYFWRSGEGYPGVVSCTSSLNKTPEKCSESVIGSCNPSVDALVTDFVPENTYLKESLSWSSVGSSSNLDDESKPSVSSQSKESFTSGGREEQLIPVIEKLQFQVEMLKSENKDLRRHMGRISQENEILRSQLQILQQSKSVASETSKPGSKRQRPVDVVATASDMNTAMVDASARKPERRKRVVKSKTLFCLSVVLGFFLIPYFFQKQYPVVRDYRGIVSKNESRPVTAIAKYVPYMEEANSSELVWKFQSKQIVKDDEPHSEFHFPALRKSADPTSESWIRRAVEAAMQLTDSYPEDIHNLLVHQKAEDFLRSYASWITHRKKSPTMLVVARDLVSVLPADVAAKASCPDPSSGSCDYSVSLLMPVRSFNESLSDCVYTSLECQLTHGRANATLRDKVF